MSASAVLLATSTILPALETADLISHAITTKTALFVQLVTPFLPRLSPVRISTLAPNVDLHVLVVILTTSKNVSVAPSDPSWVTTIHAKLAQLVAPTVTDLALASAAVVASSQFNRHSSQPHQHPMQLPVETVSSMNL